MYTQYTCITTIYTPTTPLNNPYTPYMHPTYASKQPINTPYAPYIRPIYALFTPYIRALDGRAIRIPMANASITDCVFEMVRDTTVEEVNGLLKAAADDKEGSLYGILGYDSGQHSIHPLYTLYIPFTYPLYTLYTLCIHLYSRTSTYVHPLYMYIHHIYTIYTPNTPLNTHPIHALYTPCTLPIKTTY